MTAAAEDAVGEVEAVVPAAFAEVGVVLVVLVLVLESDEAENGMEDATVVSDEVVDGDAAVMKMVVLLAAVGVGAADAVAGALGAVMWARVGSAAAIPGSGMLIYESLKMSFWAPSRKLYRLLYTGGENVPSNICRAAISEL